MRREFSGESFVEQVRRRLRRSAGRAGRAVRRAAGQGSRGTGLYRAGGNQLLAFSQRHHAVVDRLDLSDPERGLRARLRADRDDHAGVPVHGVAAAAGDRAFHRQEGAAVLALDRHGIYLLRPVAAQRGAAISRYPDRGGFGRARLGGVPPRIGTDRAAGFGRPLWLRAIGVSARRQFRYLDGAGAGGPDRGAVRPAEHRLVLLDRVSGHRDPVADRAVVQAADLGQEIHGGRPCIRTRRIRAA